MKSGKGVTCILKIYFFYLLLYDVSDILFFSVIKPMYDGHFCAIIKRFKNKDIPKIRQ